MPFCPNPECDHKRRLGEPAEFSKGVSTCSDCGTLLTEHAPQFETSKELEKDEGWTCPQCGHVNRNDLSLCSCGYDFNRSVNSEMPKAMKAISWTCPQCNQIQYEDLTRCSCGYDHVNAQKNKRVFTVQFSGSSHEYFRIWIVNLCLTLFTFGIYSAWAKVRKKRYFYSHTTVDGTPFQYLGQPIPILKGRVIAASAFVIYYISTHFFTFLLPYIFVIGAVAAPWVLIRSASFNARYSAFRNMTFHFNGTYLDALKTLYAWGVIPAFVLGMMFHWWGKAVIAGVIIFIFGISFPWWIRQVRNFLITHNSFGNKKGFFAATGGQFFAIYFKSSLIMAGIGIVIGFIAVPFATVLFEKKSLLFTWLLMLPLYTGYVIGYAYVQAHSSNLVWNHTRLGPLSFESTLSGWGMTKLYLTNALAIIATLGLLTPWAVMRTLKYRADHMKILQEGKLIEFQGSDMAAVEATGAETVDFFDMDLSL